MRHLAGELREFRVNPGPFPGVFGHIPLPSLPDPPRIDESPVRLRTNRHNRGMSDDTKATLLRYLQRGRDALVWKLEGLSEYDIRRPLVPTGTNLLGLIKHVASVEAGYLGDCFGRPFPVDLPWYAPDAEPNADMWATPEESRESILELYRKAWSHGDETVALLDLDTEGEVHWWPLERRNPSLHWVLVHVIAETHRHAGHADLVRELIDGQVGWATDAPVMPEEGADWWVGHRERVEDAAQRAAGD